MKNEPWRGLPMERVKHLEKKLANKRDQIRKLEAERDALREKLESLPSQIRSWWSFDQHQFHTHSYHTREDFLMEYAKWIKGERSLLQQEPDDERETRHCGAVG